MSSNNKQNFEQEEKPNKSNKKEEHKHEQYHKNIFNKIKDDMKDINPPKNLKKINSFLCPNIPSSKQLSKNVLENKNKTEDIERKSIKYCHLFSFMKNKEEKQKKNANKDNSINLFVKIESEKSKNNKDKINLHKESRFKKHNNGKRNFSSSVNRNFILKSDIFKLNRNNNTTNNIIYKSERVITPERNKINELSNNQFYNYFYNNNISENNNLDINNIENQKKEIKSNNNSINNNINLVKSYYGNPDSQEIKKIYNNINTTNFQNKSLKSKDDKYNNNKFSLKDEEQRREIKSDENNINNKRNNFSYQSHSSGYFYPINQPPIYFQNNPYSYTLGHYNFNYNQIYPSPNYRLFQINNQYRKAMNNNNIINNFNNNLIMNSINDINEDLNNINYISLVKTQSGSKLLKEKLLSNHKFANESLFPKIKNDLKDICCDFFGNSLINSLLDVLTYENINLFLSLISDYLYEICLTEPGSRVVQKLIEKIYGFPLLLNKFNLILNNKDIGLLIKSPYGNHIIKKYISFVKKKEFTIFIFNYIFNHFIEIVKEKYGVFVLEKFISEADNEVRKKIFLLIIDNLDMIIKDYYGHYLIQYILSKLEKIKINEIFPLIEKIEENILEYSKMKYSSSVIEKCFEFGSIEITEHMLKFLLDKHSNSIADLLSNEYGFYIIKKSLHIKRKYLKEKLIRIIVNNLDKLNDINIENKVITSFSSEHKDFSDILFEKNKGNINIRVISEK